MAHAGAAAVMAAASNASLMFTTLPLVVVLQLAVGYGSVAAEWRKDEDAPVFFLERVGFGAYRCGNIFAGGCSTGGGGGQGGFYGAVAEDVGVDFAGGCAGLLESLAD